RRVRGRVRRNRTRPSHVRSIQPSAGMRANRSDPAPRSDQTGRTENIGDNKMRETLRNKRGSGGFTLVELLITIVIIGILAAVVVLAVGGLTGTGKTSACKATQ